MSLQATQKIHQRLSSASAESDDFELGAACDAIARNEGGLAELRNPGSYRGKHRRIDALGRWPMKAVLYTVVLDRFLRWAEEDFHRAHSQEIDDV